MYITKLLDRNGLINQVAEEVNEEANKMYDIGYELVTYILDRNSDKIMMTFKKIDGDSNV